MMNSPGEIVFQCDMFINVPVIANLAAIQEQRQLLIDRQTLRQNRSRYDHHYKVNDWINVKKYDPTKGEERLHGPYQIVETRTNGTVVIDRQTDGYIEETFNIRKIVPHRGPIPENANNSLYNFYHQNLFAIDEITAKVDCIEEWTRLL